MTVKNRHPVTILLLAALALGVAGPVAVATTDIAKAKAEHWSYQPIASPDAPAVKHADRVRDPIDAFWLAKLEAADMAPAPEADRRTLIRRVYFDLIGLPPTFEQVEAFVADQSPDALAKVVDELLSSPQYGERWGRHWLDVARYADTIGYDGGGRERKFPFAWTYRDYVIRAFNDDKPYDRFVAEQIAADRMGLPEGDPALAGLGLLTVGRQFLGNTHNIVDDQIDVVTRGVMGLTVQCARCHDHKYDAVPASDYYALYGVFRSMDVPEPIDMPVIGEPMGSPEQQAKYREEMDAATKAIDDHLNAVRETVLKEIPERADDYLALVLDEKKNIDHERRRLTRQFERAWRRSGSPKPIMPEKRDEIIAKVTEESQDDPAGFFNQSERNDFNNKRGKIIEIMLRNAGAPPRAMVVTESNPFNPYVFVRGQAGSRGESVDRRFLSVLGGQKFTDGAGRLELAKAVTARDNPLTARVWVNRVWQHLFDAGLVRTPGDFGSRGEEPTHPALLDHLATRFMNDGWSTKKLIRSIVLSSVYRQASVPADSAADYAQRDPENRLIWKMNRKRLGFEPTHDAVLAVAGRLDRALYGRPVDLFGKHPSHRRAVYGFIDRQDLPQTLRAFDFASPDHSTPQRPETTVPQQALYLMNSPFVAEMAKVTAEQTAPIADAAQRVAALYRTVLTREPSAAEVETALGFLGESAGPDAWAQLAHTLMMSNEFVFVD